MGREDHRLTWARLMRSVLRQRVLAEYAQAVKSPSEVAATLRAPLNLVSYHTQVLLRAGCLDLVRTERRRGAEKHFYRADLWSDIDDATWEQLPTPMRRVLIKGTLDSSWREARDALPRGGMDPATSHVSRSFLSLDRQGRDDLATLLVETLDAARRIEQASRERAPDGSANQELVIMNFELSSSP
jgi:hypothetical protein